MPFSTKNSEPHPHLPSGPWEGFYLQYGEQGPMKLDLNFQNGQVRGHGSDPVGPFTFNGTYDLDTMRLTMTKVYATHDIEYAGSIDENGIWGTWRIGYSADMGVSREYFEAIRHYMPPGVDSGGFHIWPAAEEREATEEMVEAVERLLVEAR